MGGAMPSAGAMPRCLVLRGQMCVGDLAACLLFSGLSLCYFFNFQPPHSFLYSCGILNL